MRDKFNKLVVYLALIIGSITVLFPFFWMISTSLKTKSESLAVPPSLLPEVLQFSNYPEALEAASFGIYFINSVVVAIISTILVLITTTFAAYAFSKFDFKYKNVLFSFLLATLMIPGELLVITNFSTIANLGLIDTRIAIFLPYIASTFYIYMVSQFYMQVPHELYLAAKVDGASDFRYLTKILIPISKPILITVAMLNVIASWNSYLWPMLVTNTNSIRTLPVGLKAFTSEGGTDFHLLMAATTIVIIPMVILFILSRKYIVSGLTKGAVKG